MSVLAWGLVALPLVVGVVLTACGLTPSRRRVDRAAPPLGVATAVLTFGFAVAAAVVRPVAEAPLLAGIEAGMGVDGMSALMVITVAAAALAVLVFAMGDIRTGQARFFGLMLVFTGSMLVTVTATTLPVLLAGWEVMGATSYALIGFWWREPHRIRAATTAFIVTRTADLGLYLAAGAAIAGGAGSLALVGLPAVATPWLGVATAGVVVAAFGKSAQLPFSFWLARAMEGPSPVSALLHSATMVAAGVYLLVRLHPLLAVSGWAEPVVAWTGAATAVVLGLVAVAQTDLKRLLAASTCAQLGFMVMAAGAGGAAAAIAHLIAHAATKSLLFLAAGVWLTMLGTKELAMLAGAARGGRLVAATFTVGMLALAGLPPLSLWLTKDQVLATALHHSSVLYLIGLAAMMVSAVYSAKALWYVWRPACTAERRQSPIPLTMGLPLVPLAFGAAVLGVLAIPPIADSLNRAITAGAEPSATAPEQVLSAMLALGAAAATWSWRARPPPLPKLVPRWLGDWLGLARVVRLAVVRPALALARALARFDDRVLDRAVLGVVPAGRATARMLGRFDDHTLDGAVTRTALAGCTVARLVDRRAEWSVDSAVAALATGARRLARLARRPQTGLLHQYYAQAVAALAVLALILLVLR